jgi:transcriptional regulator with XRE-family HTH domain
MLEVCWKRGEARTLMGKWEQLIAARERLHLSQVEAAERLGVGVATYQRWEMGKRKPQPQHLRDLYALFDLQPVSNEPEAGLMSAQAEVRGALCSSSCAGDLSLTLFERERDWEGSALLATRLVTHLWSLVVGGCGAGDKNRAVIRQAGGDIDCMHTYNEDDRLTRREAIVSLAALPLVTFGLALPGKELATARYAEALVQCAASLQACWELYEHGGASELQLGFQCTSRYLTVLQRIGQTSTRHREEALRLATAYALLKTLLSRHCTGAVLTTQCAWEAIALSQETGDIPLQLSAYTKLTWTYLYEKYDRQALLAAQEAQAVLEYAERQAGGELLPPGIRGGVYSALALALARNRLPSDQALAKAMERDPGTQVHAYLDFTRASMLLEAGWVYYTRDDYTHTMQVLEKRVDPETFAPRMPGVSEVGRVETLNLMALSSLHAKDCDLSRAVHLWQAAVEGAKALHSSTLLQMVFTTYRQLTAVWSGEAQVRDLQDHLAYQEDA